MTVLVRPAVAADRDAILALARGERVNPTGLHWPRFFVAERDGELVGAVQMRLHHDGAHELGTLVVAQQARNQGIAAQLINALLSRDRGRVFMVTGRKHAEHYARWASRRSGMPGTARCVAQLLDGHVRRISVCSPAAAAAKSVGDLDRVAARLKTLPERIDK